MGELPDPSSAPKRRRFTSKRPVLAPAIAVAPTEAQTSTVLIRWTTSADPKNSSTLEVPFETRAGAIVDMIAEALGIDACDIRVRDQDIVMQETKGGRPCIAGVEWLQADDTPIISGRSVHVVPHLTGG